MENLAFLKLFGLKFSCIWLKALKLVGNPALVSLLVFVTFRFDSFRSHSQWSGFVGSADCAVQTTDSNPISK